MKRSTQIHFAVIVVAVVSVCCSTRGGPEMLPLDSPHEKSREATNDPAPIQFPSRRGFVNDFAGILTPQATNRLEDQLQTFKTESGVQLDVAIVETTGGLNGFDYSLSLARSWGIGSDTRDRAGILLLVSMDDRTWNIQISRTLEKYVSNAEIADIGDSMGFLLRVGRYDEGITKCVNDLVRIVSLRRAHR